MFKSLFNKKTKEEKFWDWFLKNESHFFYGTDNEDSREELFDKLTKKVSEFHEDLTFEFSPIKENDVREFAVSADGIKDAFNSVINLINVAPKHDHWEFVAFRQRIDGDDIAIEMGDVKLSYKNIYFRLSQSNNEFGIELNIENFKNTGAEQNAIYILLDSLLGEYDVVKEIDWIEWAILEESKKEILYPLFELRNIVDKRKSERLTP